jgi:hypothetical protein
MSMPLSHEFWHYLVRWLHPCIVLMYFSKTKTSVRHYSDLSMLSQSSTRQYSIIWIMTPDSFTATREIFEYTFGIGSRNNPPRKGAPRKVLELGHKINVVNQTDLMGVQQQHFEEFIASERVDFVYEELCKTVSI